MRKKTHAEFLEQTKHFPFDVIGQYENTATKILLRCTIDEFEWSALPRDLLKGRGCPVCGKKRQIQKQKRTNDIIEDHGDWLLIDISTVSYPSKTMQIDRSDWAFIQPIGRVAYLKHGYPCVNKHRQSVRIHRLILNLTTRDEYADHKDHDKTNNRRSNIRSSTSSTNQMNRRVTNNNTSGSVGVNYRKDTNKWSASITVNGKMIALGGFVHKRDAIVARGEAEKKHFGEFRYSETQDKK